ncbi:DUF1850 domain-containing protein [Brevibacillus sp. AY1]|uniref:DUF1850 domain-containing protein n=2 Tax=Brevibacillus invocatus TaxID=173959 RepID=A0A3M8CEY5_9BACL|nr:MULTISPECIES: DUF1850 domain-containing protein [Brevibacillus]MDH4616543.1 DUF1850 domain-containing protein [Brevibacillus sp. AY1]RNB74304.1 DUF1850 domain-containing protein [Brevibacillus invocatus]
MIANKQEGRQKRRTRLRLFTFMLLATCIVLLNLPLFPSLVIRDSRSEQLVWSSRIKNDATFGMRWTHSIHRSSIEELYRIEQGQIILSEMTFHDYGIGMENDLAPGEELIFQDGQFRVLHMNRVFPALHLITGQVRADHTLLFAGTQIPLRSLIEPGSAITIQAEKRSILSEIGGY